MEKEPTTMDLIAIDLSVLDLENIFFLECRQGCWENFISEVEDETQYSDIMLNFSDILPNVTSSILETKIQSTHEKTS